MYDFLKIDNEDIVLISDDSILKKNNENLLITTILTNKRMILLDYPNKGTNYEEALKTSRGVDYILKKEPILIVDLLDIKSITIEGYFDKYVLDSSNYFYLNDIKVRDQLSTLLPKNIK